MVILREKEMLEKGQFFRGGQEKDHGEEILKNLSHIGFAVDVGTTTVVVAGFAFLRGKKEPLFLGRKTERNEQTKLGKDVMMRVMHAVEGKQKKLQQMIVEQVERMALEILPGEDGGDGEQWLKADTEFVVVGNTTMCHLFLGESVEGLKGAPFRMSYQGNREVPGSYIGFRIFLSSAVFVLSGIAAHVGSDALSVVCETKMQKQKKNQLAIDLGTNAEIILNKAGELWCCSAAAGPAFEGRGVASGRAAGAGVITGVKLASHTGNIILEYIPGKEICGICGSGLIDALAGLRKIGAVTEDGYLSEGKGAGENRSLRAFAEYMTEDEKGDQAFCFYKGKENILLTQKDIRNLQLAKGAIAAAVFMILKETGLEAGQLDEIILTGVLGSSIRLENAMHLGLIPSLPRECFRLAGNAALDGAVSLLKDGSLKKEWEGVSKKIRHIELAEKEGFQEVFMGAMEFRGWN